jgi:hypothetical protein
MLTIPVVRAMRSIRTMRGQTRAQLIVASDGQYVVKYSNNPVGRRVLVNELISSLTLKHLGIRTPNFAFISVDEEVLANNPEIGVATAGTVATPPAGLHFGCHYVGVGSKPVYDFLPDKLLPDVINRNDFFGVLVFDKWVSNSDRRQAVFYRKNAIPSGHKEPNGQWITEMIDHESAFHGGEWTFRDSPPQGLYPCRPVYEGDLSVQHFKPWLDRIDGLGAEFFRSLLDSIPPQWIAGEEEQASTLLGKLRNRRYRLSGLVEEALVYIRAKQGRGPVAVENSLTG